MPCPFGPRFPGWRLLVEAFYNPAPGRTYGEGTYGSDVYGDINDVGPLWVDITTPMFDITVTVGATATTSPVPVNELVIELRDDLGAWWDFAAPARYNLPFIWAPVRVGLLDPADGYHPVGYGRAETIEDPHNRPPRIVTITAYGSVSTLVTSKVGWSRGAELVDVRIAELIAAGGPVPYTIDPVERPLLHGDTEASTIDVRDELDRTAASAGWLMTEDPSGTVRFRRWPLEAAGTALVVTDCIEADNPDSLLAGDTLYVADTASLLNVAAATNTVGDVVERTDPTSIALYDQHSQTFGFPYTDLAFTDVDFMQAVVDRSLIRWSNVINHVDAVNVDTTADRRWLPVLADLAIGQPLRVDRRGIRPFTLDTIVTGWRHHLRRNRCETTIYTSTITPTL